MGFITLVCHPAVAAMRDVGAAAPVAVSSAPSLAPSLTPSPAHSLSLSPSLSLSRLSFLVGASTFKGETGVAFGLRCRLNADPALGTWFLELGGTPPHDVTGYGSASAAGTFPGLSVNGQTASYSEAHLTISDQFYRIGLFSVEAGAGISVAELANRADFTVSPGTPFPYALEETDHATRLSPWVSAGLEVHLTERLSVHLDAAYLDYTNKQMAQGSELDLSFRGVMVRPAVEWTF